VQESFGVNEYRVKALSGFCVFRGDLEEIVAKRPASCGLRSQRVQERRQLQIAY